MKNIQILAMLLLLNLSSSSVFAGDGVINLNQTCATQVGCFSGDVAGFPITISALTTNKSFRLTSDLIILDSDTHVIHLSTSNISIDLNGFTIRCAASNCKNSSGKGIVGAYQKRILIKNGYISNMGSTGIDVGGFSKIYNMSVFSNGGNGIKVGSFSMVKDCIVTNNSLNGIIASDSFGSTSIVVQENILNLNGISGIYVGENSSVNENIVSNHKWNGIVVKSGSSVRGNTVANNKNIGLSLYPDVIYLQNMMTGNNLNSVTGGINMGQNYCNNQVCP